MKRTLSACLVLVTLAAGAASARADEVTDWNRQMLRAALLSGTSPTNLTRFAAMVEVAVFDAVNGLDPKYQYFLVNPASAPAGASKRAAAVQAAYAMLTKIYGSGAATPNLALQGQFDSHKVASLSEIGEDESQSAISSGLTWGQTVADQVFAARANDGFSVTQAFPNGTLPGQWRQTPNLPGAGTSAAGAGYKQFSEQLTWALPSASSVPADGPPQLSSPQYAADFNETKTMGSRTSTLRTPDQTTFSLFWNSTTVSYLWNTVALNLLEERERDGDHYDRGESWKTARRHRLLEHARLLSVLGVSMADAIIGCWNNKYEHAFWRPITAIRDTADDGNAATTPDPDWMPLFATPGHPEYPSGHSCGSGAAGEVLAREFGERTRITMDSDQLPGVTRSFRSFSAALEEVKNARIYAGIHFRTACDDGQKLGKTVAQYVLENKFQRIK